MTGIVKARRHTAGEEKEGTTGDEKLGGKACK